jgi:hypothetical protein
VTYSKTDNLVALLTDFTPGYTQETLLQRTAVLEEYQSAAKVTITKRRTAERLKGSSNIASNKVDDAIDEMEEVSVYDMDSRP